MVIRRAGFPRVVRAAAPPEVLTVSPGDKIRVTCEFDYTGPKVSGWLYGALYHPTLIDPHDEIARDRIDIALPDSPTARHWTGDLTITVPSGFAGSDFGLYCKVGGPEIPDVISPYYDNVIEIVAGVPEITELVITEYVKA